MRGLKVLQRAQNEWSETSAHSHCQPICSQAAKSAITVQACPSCLGDGGFFTATICVTPPVQKEFITAREHPSRRKSQKKSSSECPLPSRKRRGYLLFLLSASFLFSFFFVFLKCECFSYMVASLFRRQTENIFLGHFCETVARTPLAQFMLNLT